MQNGNFDDLASDYGRFRTGYSPDLIDGLFDLGVQPGSSIVDVGAGTGLSAEPLVARGVHVTGIDASAKMLAVARMRVPAATFHEGRAEALPFPNGSFDGAISAQTFHWFDQAAALREMIRVVKPGGPVAIWWKVLASDDDIRTFRAAACARVGVSAAPDVLGGGFRAFYGAPFARRALRVVPFVARLTVAQCVGYERSRAQARNHFGGRRAAYLAAFEQQLLDTFKTSEERLEIRYTQYLYVGYSA